MTPERLGELLAKYGDKPIEEILDVLDAITQKRDQEHNETERERNLRQEWESLAVERITQLKAALDKLWKHTPKIDNGYCQVCRRAHRTWFFDKELGPIPNKCPDVDCLSHIVEAALAAPVAQEGPNS